MADEASNTSIPTPAAAAPAAPAETPSIVIPEGPVTTLEERTDIVDKRGPLFGDEKKFSEAELTGEEGADDTPAAPAKPAEPGAKEDAVTSPPKGADGKDLTAQEKEAAAAAEEAGKAADPVVKATEGIRRELTTERAQRRALEQQLDDAQRTIAAIQQTPAQPAGEDPMAKFKDFKELSDEEFAEKVSTDYAAAQIYLKELADFREAKRTATDQEKQQKARAQYAERNMATIINGSREVMEKEVPGLFDPNSDVQQKLIGFARDNGMDVDLLAALTDPGSVLTEREAKTGKFLGRGAVATLRFLNNVYQAEQRIRTELTEQITNDVLTKFKIDAGVYKSLGDHPSAPTPPVDDGQHIGEDEYRKLSEADKQRALGG
jgi:hypothetical protein